MAMAVPIGLLIKDERGTTAVLAALALAAILGMIALGVETAHGLMVKRGLQAAADSAARAGALALRAGAPAAATEAGAVAGLLLPAAASGARITVAHPPSSGAFRGDAGSVEVRIDAGRRIMMAPLLGAGDGAVAVRAVARLIPVREGCILALRPGTAGTLTAIRPADLRLAGCTALAAEAGIPALRLEEADPYRGRVPPGPAGCSATGLVVSDMLEVPAGRPAAFCGGLVIRPGGRVVLGPGVHAIDGGVLLVMPGGTLVTDGATILLRGTGGRAQAVVNIQPGAIVRLRAPASGPGAGLAVASEQAGAATHVFASGGLAVSGAVRLPGATLLFAGNAGGGCAQLIADVVRIIGPTELAAGCPGTGMAPLVDRVARLVE